jgi:hypothetical protein
VRFFFIALLVSVSVGVRGQFVPDEQEWIEQLNLKGAFPEKILSSRTAVFYDYLLTSKELTDTQQQFQQSGIDAVVYFELDMVMAGKDITRTFGDYLLKREISNLIFIEKNEGSYRITATVFNGKETVIEPTQSAWSVSNTKYEEALKQLYLTISSQQKRQNLLINDLPETGMSVNPIRGKRNEFFAIDAKVDPLAVPKTGDPAVDAELEQIFSSSYSLKYKLTEPGTPEKELRKQGLLYVVCVVRTRDIVAKELLGYDMSKSESAIVSVTYPDTQQQLKNIPSNTTVYKFYFKHIDSGNVFLGNKWDADLTWQTALLNQLRGMKSELRLN